MRIALLITLVFAGLLAIAQETPVPPVTITVSTIGAELYAPLDQLSTALGITVNWKADASSVKLTAGKTSLTLTPGSIVALNAQGRRFCLSQPPVIQGTQLQVPVWSVATALGGKRNETTDGSYIILGAKTALLGLINLPVVLDSPEVKITDALTEPRLPLDALASGNGFTVKARPYLEGFAKVARPVQPMLTGIATSQPLKLLGHVPVVGSFVSLCQDSVGAINGTIGFAQKLIDLDNQLLVPMRDGCVAATALKADPNAGAILAARPKWTAAVAAADRQLALYSTAAKQVNGVLWRLNQIDNSLAAIRNSYPQVTGSLSLNAAKNASRDLIVTIDAHRWQLRALKDYFTRLLDVSAPLQPAPEGTQNPPASSGEVAGGTVTPAGR